jgi:hypothetical protein
MGEAKRKRVARESLTTTTTLREHDPETGGFADRIVEVKHTVSPQRWLAEMGASVASGKPMSVPCNGCRNCCWFHHVPVERDENPENLPYLDTVMQEDSSMILRKRDDGACVHLGEQGCTVYEHRPAACRTYDCRYMSLIGISHPYDDNHSPPTWLFDVSTDESKAVIIAFRMSTLVAVRPGEPVEAATYRQAFGQMGRHLPVARKIVAYLKKIPTNMLNELIAHG